MGNGNRTDDLHKHGAQSPDNYEEKTEVGDVFHNIALATEKKERGVAEGEKPELNIGNDPIEDSKYNLSGSIATQPQQYFVLDVETYQDRNMKDDYRDFFGGKIGKLVDPIKIKAKIKANQEKFALSPTTGEVILIGLLDGNGKEIQIGLDGSTEKVILEDGWRAINNLLKAGYRMVSYNGKAFDLPFLFIRGLINGIASTPTIAINTLTHPYNNHQHYDCFNVLGEGSLEQWNYLFGYGENYENINGAMIGEMFEKKEFAEIRAKNIGDLRKTGRLYELLKGWVVG